MNLISSIKVFEIIYSFSISRIMVTILIRFNMVSLSCGPMQDFRPGKEKLYEYPAEITPVSYTHLDVYKRQPPS